MEDTCSDASKYMRFVAYCKSLSHDKLVPYLYHRNTEQRLTAAMELRDRGTEKARLFGLRLCKSADWKLRDAGATILSDIKIVKEERRKEVRDVLFHLAWHDPKIVVRRTALIGIKFKLGEDWIPQAEAYPLFEAMSRSRSWRLRLGVAMALPLECDGDIDLMLRLMADPVGIVRDWAAFSVGLSEYDTPELRVALLTIANNDTDMYARKEAVASLVQLKDERLLPALQFLLTQDGEFLWDVLAAASDFGNVVIIPDLNKFIQRNTQDASLVEFAQEILDELNHAKRD